MKKIINVADLVNPETGKSFRQENNEKKHRFNVGDHVEITEDSGRILTAQILKQSRDCDGTPLYEISSGGYSEEGMRLICPASLNR